MRRHLAPPLLAALVIALTPVLGTDGAGAVEAQEPPTTVVYLVRHAETEPDGTRDPALSSAGRERATALARTLSGAGLTAIHTTPYRRTRGTAGAVAEAVGLEPREYDPAELEAVASRLLEEAGTHLVVGHSNTTPELVRLLGGDPGGPISEDEYDRVYVVRVGPEGTRTVVTGTPEVGPSGQADSADVESVDAILAALYDVLSGPAGEARDWDRMRSLFLPSARLIPVQRGADGEVSYRALTVEDYIRTSGPVLEELGFREVEVARRLERFGEVAHAFSTYEGYREGVDDPILRGLNSIQLIHDGDRWWIASVAWAPERPDLPLPQRYSPSGG